MQPPQRSPFTLLNRVILLIVIWTMAACSNTRYLQHGQRLFVSTNVEVKGDLQSTDKQDLRSALTSKSLMLQQPNKTFLGTRIKVWLHNQKQYEKKSNWLWNLLLSSRNIETPVIYDSVKTRESAARMISYLNNQGYFYAGVSYQEKTKNQKTSLTYHVNTGKNFTLDKITYEIPDSNIRAVVLGAQQFSLLKKDMPYKQETVGSERERLVRLVKDAGYFKFNRDAIEFEMDTLNKTMFRNLLNPFEGMANAVSDNAQKQPERPTMDVLVRIKNPEDTNIPYEKYTIDSVFVYPDFPINGNARDTVYKTSKYKDLTIRAKQDILRPRILEHSILLKDGDTYSPRQYNNTINKLYDLGVWQFVTLQYVESKQRAHSLDAYAFLTPKRRQELGANFEVSTSSDYFVGSGVGLNYRHINLNRAANQLSITLNTGLEMIRNEGQFNLQAKQFGGEINLTFPRFITPFGIGKTARSTVKTRLSAGVNYLSRIDRFDISSINAAFGYEWNESLYKRWIVKPISLNYVGVNLNQTFRDSVVSKNPYLERSFTPAFIGGENVTFIFTNNDILHNRHYSFFRANIEESGLWLNGISSLVDRISNGRTDLETSSGLTISNFVKLELDYRHYWKLTQHTSLATRLYTGVGIPYSKSEVLPYIRQFTSGGPNSIRAWRLRTLGPGSYRDTTAQAAIFPDQTGDLKLEGNIEYRFDLLRMFNGSVNLKGATFLDFGNIWMLKKDTVRPGSEFRISNLYRDLAIGTGVGIRLDFSFFLIRLDWGVPLKVPYNIYNPDNKNGWYLSEWDLKDPQWRKQNIIWNIAIGYPF